MKVSNSTKYKNNHHNNYSYYFQKKKKIEEKTIFPPGRYAEPFVSSFLSIPIIYFSSRKEEDEEGEEGGERERRKEGLRRGIEQAKEIFDLDLIIFCDGGGIFICLCFFLC